MINVDKYMTLYWGIGMDGYPEPEYQFFCDREALDEWIAYHKDWRRFKETLVFEIAKESSVMDYVKEE